MQQYKLSIISIFCGVISWFGIALCLININSIITQLDSIKYNYFQYKPESNILSLENMFSSQVSTTQVQLENKLRILTVLLIIFIVLLILGFIISSINRRQKNDKKNFYIASIGFYTCLIGIVLLITASIPGLVALHYSYSNFSEKNSSAKELIIDDVEIAYFDMIGEITTRTKDTPIPSSITVEIILGYDPKNPVVLNELISRRFTLRDFIRRYFAGRQAVELSQIQRREIEEDIKERLNTELLNNVKIKDVIIKSIVIEQ